MDDVYVSLCRSAILSECLGMNVFFKRDVFLETNDGVLLTTEGSIVRNINLVEMYLSS